MWEEIQDMPGEIFDIEDWKQAQEENEEPGWDLNGFDEAN
jgi:hypothetical protein